VEQQLNRILSNAAQLAEWIHESTTPANLARAIERAGKLRETYATSDPQSRRSMLRQLFRRITVRQGCISLDVDRQAIARLLLRHADLEVDGDSAALVRIDCPFTLRRRGVEARIVLTNGTIQQHQPDQALVDLVRRAQRYLVHLTDGSNRSLTDVATVNGTEPSEVSRILPFAFLSPKLTEAILTGTQPKQLTAQRLSRMADLPYSWSEQHARLATCASGQHPPDPKPSFPQTLGHGNGPTETAGTKCRQSA
jgi:site-specific DNA recombinase